MIYLEGLGSIIECVYLGDGLSNKSSDCDVFINPDSTKYLVGKTVIINDVNYPIEKIKSLVSNSCRVISRLYTDSPDVEVRPYIMKLCFSVMWNGRVLHEYKNLNDIFESNNCDFDIDTYSLYFPKIDLDLVHREVVDKYNNLSALGWALQQVGINIIKDTPFINQDVIKTGKVML